ncbi:hypothetical protein [Pseudarthrobacter scleromae]|uniref:hypothetical protein n=1 Tax=Pseudarthrobacter scleromae TaxID=158897 RepID=UPI003D078BC0
MTLGDAAAEPLVHIRNLRTDFLVLRLAVHLLQCWSTGYGRKLSVAGTFRRKELAAK